MTRTVAGGKDRRFKRTFERTFPVQIKHLLNLF